jgi:mannose-1-phosphate guanylyltransferase
MILVAGEGLRARPLTDFLAKPALPIPGGTILSYLLDKLDNSEFITDVALNLHYLPNSIKNVFKDMRFNNIAVSPFEEKILAGSGGGFYRIREFFSDEPFLVLNGDSIHGFNLNELVEFHQSHNLPVSFLCQPDNTGKIRVIDADDSLEVVAIRKEPTPENKSRSYNFSGMMVINPTVFKWFPQNKEMIDLFSDVLIPALRRGERVGKVLVKNFELFELGTPADYFANNFRFLDLLFNNTSNISEYVLKDGYYIHKSVKLDKTVELSGRGYIGQSVEAGAVCRIENTIIHTNSRVTNCILENVVILGAELDSREERDSIILPDSSKYNISRNS